jgi:hypothetical protein
VSERPAIALAFVPCERPQRRGGDDRIQAKPILDRVQIVRLRNPGLISNEIMHRVERELDLEDERLDM